MSGIVENIRHLREAPQREEEAQQKRRSDTLTLATEMLKLGIDKNQIARELGKAGFALPEREVTARGFEREVEPGEDPGGLTKRIPFRTSTRREVDLSGLETPRDIHAREQAGLEGRETRQQERAFGFGQQGAEAAVRREDVRRAQFPTTDEMFAEILKKIKDGVTLTPEDNRFVADAVKLRSGDPGAKRHFEDEIITQFRAGGLGSLNVQQREYFDSQMQTRDPEAAGRAARGEVRAERGLELQEERTDIAREGQRAGQVERGEARADAARDRMFAGLNAELRRTEAKFAKQRETEFDQTKLGAIDSAEASERAQIIERWKRQNKKFAPDIDEAFGSQSGGRPPSFRGLFDVDPQRRQGTPRG